MKQNNVFRAQSQKSVSNKGKRIQIPSKVLFVTIYDPILFQLTNDFIFNTFNKYGKVVKVLIFQKVENTKFFIEFTSIQESQKAKQNLQGTMLHNNYCKMHIFYSKLEQVNLKNKNTQGKDYSSVHTQTNKQMKNNFAFFENIKTEKKITDDFALYRSQQTLDFSKFKSKTDESQLDKIINILRRQEIQNEQKDEQFKSFEKPVEKFEQEEFSEFQKKVAKKINYDNSEYKESIVNKKNTQFLSFSFQQKIPLIHVYNLFSNYGNIERIVLKNSNIYVQFENVEFAVIAKDYLQNVTLNSNILRLNYSNRSDILEKTNQYSERINFDDSFKRFNSNKSISINPPSKILHISNIKQQITNVQSLTKIFEEVVTKVQKIQILTKSEEKNMALLKLYSMEDSIRVLVHFHNKLLNDRKMQISFTKSKI